MYDVIVIGMGASGLFALSNISSDIKALGLESNEVVGKKLSITGGGRCNLTQTKDVKSLVSSYTHPSFVRPILYSFNNRQLMDYFEENGLPLVVYNTSVYPKSESAKSVVDFFLNQINKRGHKLKYNERVTKIDFSRNKTLENEYLEDKMLENDVLCEIKGNINEITDKNSNNTMDIEDVITVETNKGIYKTKSIVIATGGASYKATGSDGELISKHFDIAPFKPAMCYLYFNENIFSRLKGVSIEVQIQYKKRVFSGSLLFAEEFCTGPVIYDLSNYAYIGDEFSVDFIPNISAEKLRKFIVESTQKNPKKLLKNIFMDKESILKHDQFNSVPENFIKLIFEKLNLDKCTCANLKNKDLVRLVDAFKKYKLNIIKKSPIDKAIVTIGGVKIDEIDNKTMYLKSNNRVFVIGEAIELVGNCGGYNLQFAFSSAMRAVKYINKLYSNL